MAVPPAPTMAPMMPAIALDVPHPLVQVTSTMAHPMTPPAAPPMRMATKASARASGEGSADKGRDDGVCGTPAS